MLGEAILAAAKSIIEHVRRERARRATLIGACSLVIVAAMWWIYFDRPQHDQTVTRPRAYFWGYLHYFIFASAAAFSAGVEVAIAVRLHESHLNHTVAGTVSTLTIPLAVFVVATWLVLDAVRRDAIQAVGTVVLTATLVATAVLPYPLLGAAAVMLAAAALVSWRHAAENR